MKTEKSGRGFRQLMHPGYPPGKGDERIASESSAIGDYSDSFEKPGSSFLWIGANHHLNREEVGEFIACLNHWLQTGRLPAPEWECANERTVKWDKEQSAHLRERLADKPKIVGPDGDMPPREG